MADIDKDGTIFVGMSTKPEVLTLAFANRHGLVTGATGTGKTVTLQVLAEAMTWLNFTHRAWEARFDRLARFLHDTSQPNDPKGTNHGPEK